MRARVFALVALGLSGIVACSAFSAADSSVDGGQHGSASPDAGVDTGNVEDARAGGDAGAAPGCAGKTAVVDFTQWVQPATVFQQDVPIADGGVMLGVDDAGPYGRFTLTAKKDATAIAYHYQSTAVSTHACLSAKVRLSSAIQSPISLVALARYYGGGATGYGYASEFFDGQSVQALTAFTPMDAGSLMGSGGTIVPFSVGQYHLVMLDAHAGPTGDWVATVTTDGTPYAVSTAIGASQSKTGSITFAFGLTVTNSTQAKGEKVVVDFADVRVDVN